MTLHSCSRYLSTLYCQGKVQKVTRSAQTSHTGSGLQFTALDAVKFANMRKCTLGYRMPLNGCIVLCSVSPLRSAHFPRLCNRKANKKKQLLEGQAPDRSAATESSHGCTVGCYCFSRMPNNTSSH